MAPAEAAITQGGSGIVRRHETAGRQRQEDDAHRLLRVLEPVPERHRRRREGLREPEPAVRLVRVPVPERPHDAEHHGEREAEPDNRGDQHRDQDLVEEHRPVHQAAGRDRRTDEATDEGVRRRRRKSEVPGDQVPGDGTEKATHDDDETVGGRPVGHDGVGDGVGDGLAEERADEVHHRRQHQRDPGRQGPRRHRRGDGVRRVVEAVREVEHESDHDQPDDDSEDHPRHLLPLAPCRCADLACGLQQPVPWCARRRLRDRPRTSRPGCQWIVAVASPARCRGGDGGWCPAGRPSRMPRAARTLGSIARAVRR